LSTVQKLIETIKENKPESNKALSTLIKIGVPSVVKEQPVQIRQLLEELYTITGRNFVPLDGLLYDEGALYEKVEMWWRNENNRYETGCLYKYGSKQNLAIIFD
jgi:hypothetical protein